MKAIPFFDLFASHTELRYELNSAYDRVLTKGSLILGEEVAAFEKEFSSFCNVRHCISVGNGLDALALTLRAWGVGPGDEVIVPSHTFIATWLAVSMVGATPVAVEIDPRTYLLNIDLVAAALSSKTRAIIPVHLYGKAFNVKKLRGVIPSSVRILEDAAQAHGSKLNGVVTGSLGDAAAFSFYPTKNLGALGDGGAVTTNDLELALKIRDLRNYGSSQKYLHKIKGVNSRLDELQAAFLRAKLPSLDAWNQKRLVIAKRYSHRLAGIDSVQLPTFGNDGSDVFHLYVIGTPRRDDLAKYLTLNGISTLVHYPVAAHMQDAYKEMANCDLPIASHCSKYLLSLPIWPQMEESDVDRVTNVIRDFFTLST